MTGIEAHAQLCIANNYPESSWAAGWFERDMQALAEAKAAYANQEIRA
jgi:hypothetical protein